MFFPNKTYGYFLREDADETGDSGGVETEAITDSNDADPTAEAVEKVKEAFSARLSERDQKLAEQRRLNKELKERLDAIEQAKRTELEEAEAIAQQAEQEKLLKQQKYDEALALQKKQAATEIETKDNTIKSLHEQLKAKDEQIQKALINRDFNTAFMGSGGFEDQAELLFPKYSGRLSFNFETNQTEIINPATGDPLTDGNGNPYTVETFVEGVIKEAHPSSFSAQIKGGTGADATKRSPTRKSDDIPFEEVMRMPSSRRARMMGAKAGNS